MPKNSQRSAVRAFSQKAIQAPSASGRRAATSGRYTEAARQSANSAIKRAQAARTPKTTVKQTQAARSQKSA